MPLPPLPDAQAVRFLRWALPRMGMRWEGFRKVRRQVRRRLKRRLAELGLDDLAAYRELLRADSAEWDRLEALCRITVSRFYRDRRVFEVLAAAVLPDLARSAAAAGRDRVGVWSAGCGAGEEPYTLAILAALALPAPPAGVGFDILGTDADDGQLERARRAIYPTSSVRELPARYLTAFEPVGERLRLRPEIADRVRFARRELRREPPAGRFDLVLCRNLAFTYFVPEVQRQVLAGLLERLVAGGALVIGSHERLPEGPWPLVPHPESGSILIRPRAAGRAGAPDARRRR